MTRPQRVACPALIPTSLVRITGCFALLALLAACAGQAPTINELQEAAQYAAHASGNYTPPGPPEDPWGPYIQEASRRFDVPDTWVRAVMNVESGGQLYLNGQLTTSPVGAMGLMQVMPQTYDELREEYSSRQRSVRSAQQYPRRDRIPAGDVRHVWIARLPCRIQRRTAAAG